MAIRHYLAMTAAEIRGCGAMPPFSAWMACHFSPYSTGLSALPRALPPGSMLVLDDITPIHGHDPGRILAQLRERTEALKLDGVLLDFQRPGYGEAAALAETLAKELKCPLGVSDLYAGEGSGAVFLPPLSLTDTLEKYGTRWRGRELWMEVSPLGETITLTDQGSSTEALPPSGFPEEGFREARLHCRYHSAVEPDRVKFRLWRNRQDWEELLAAAEELGVTRTVGLYQQWGPAGLGEKHSSYAATAPKWSP